MKTCTMLNMTGDVTIAWTDENSKEIKDWIEDKLSQGCTFFIVEKKMKFIPVKKKIKSTADLPSVGEVKLSDSDAAKAFSKSDIKVEKDKFMFKSRKQSTKLGDKGAEKLVESGAAETVVRMDDYRGRNKVIKATTDADEIMNNDTICSRRLVGG